jgi:hypothetical protein
MPWEGGLDPQDPDEVGVESNLDTQFAFGLTFPIESTYFSTASSSAGRLNNGFNMLL